MNLIRQDKKNTIAAWWRRSVAVVLLALAGGAVGEAWAANVQFIIVNNKGKQAFNYTMNTTKLAVDAKAKSIYAENFRFYTSESDAIADAGGYAEGATIGSGTGGNTTGPFYVRYDAKSTRIGSDSSKKHLIRVRNRSGLLWFVYFDKDDSKLKMTNLLDGGENFDYSKYLWQFDDGGDPYDVYITSDYADQTVAGGTLTAADVSTSNKIPYVTYQTKVADASYNQSATSNFKLQTFFFTQGSNSSPFKYGNGWSSIWSNSCQLVGAYNGITYQERDGYNSGWENNMPYYLCANGDPNKSGYMSNGFQFQCFRSWRAEDTNSSNISQIQVLGDFAVFHIVNKSGNIAISKLEDSPSSTLTLPSEIKSPYIAEGNYRFFNSKAEAAAYSNAADAAARTAAEASAITTLAEVTDKTVFVGYYYDKSAKPAELPALDGNTWYQVKDRYNNTDNYFYSRLNANGKPENSSICNSATHMTGALTDDYHLWKLTGNDPYAIYLSNKWMNENKGNGSDLPIRYGNIAQGWFRQMAGYYATGHPMMLLTYDATYVNMAVVSTENSLNYYEYLYFLGANGNNGSTNVQFMRNSTPTSPLYKSDRVAARLQFLEVPIRRFNYRLTTSFDHELTWQADYDVSVVTTIPMPTELSRKYISSYRFYSDAACTNEITTCSEVESECTLGEDGYDIYVKYTVDEANLPFQVSTDYLHAKWYRINVVEGGDDVFAHLSDNAQVAGSDLTYTHDYQYAFFGDPYELQVMNRAGGDGKYLGVAAGATNQTPILPIANGTALNVWEILPQGTEATTDIRLRVFGTATTTPYYCGFYSASGDLLQGKACYYTSPITMHLEELPTYSYTYHIVDNTGRIAIQETVEQDLNTPILFENLPANIRSPYIADETITGYLDINSTGTSNGRTTYSLSNQITETPEADDDIYIRYTTNNLSGKTLKIDGKRSYNLSVFGNYAYADGTAVEHQASKESNANFVWSLFGNDPYAVQLRNAGTGTFVIMNPANPSTLTLGDLGLNTFFILLGTESMTPKWTLAGDVYDATATPATGKQSPVSNSNLTFSTDIFSGTLYYHIIDRSHQVVIKATSSETDLAVPAEISSPLVSRYYFWKLSSLSANADGTGTPDVDDADATYYVKAGEEEITSIGDALGGGDIHIYCTYDVADENMFANAKHYRAKGYDVALEAVDDGNGGTVNNNEAAPTYMLKFLYGENFRQEDGKDGVMAVGQERKAVYPYSNGDASLYVYGSERWNLQLESGASTRTRWLWYLESETLDPYHVKISSYQTQTNYQVKDAGGKVLSTTNYHSYFRTYKPEGHSAIVTGVTNDNPKATGGSAGDPANSSLATEYMILGAVGHGKLVTVLPVTGSGKTDDGTVATREKVTSFEQYWKNNPTVEAIAGANPAADNATLTGTYGWHAYTEFANAAPWGGGSKTYASGIHWYQTISMGDGVPAEQAGEFTLEETTLRAVLVLLDKHGWEITRTNLPNGPTDPKRAEYYAELRKYSSPMVKAYHYWKNGSKEPGYHKYVVSDYAEDGSGNEYTTPELGVFGTLPDYELQGKVGNMSRDWYVTYDVKDEYASSYIGAATEGAVQSSSFLIGQGNGSSTKWLKTDDGVSLSYESKPATYDDITTAYQWRLKPNFNIDREMGYLYAGEAGAQPEAMSQSETEADYYAAGRNGFDPYNMQIESARYTSRYLKLNSVESATLASRHWTSSGTGTVGIGDNNAVLHPVGHDQSVLNITNTVFMVIDDGNGNMRLMPRFDNERFVTLTSTPTHQLAEPLTAAAANDEVGSQTLLLIKPTTYTYHLINKSGSQAITYKDQYMQKGVYAPNLPDFLKAYGAQNYRFYPLSEFDPEPLSRSLYRLVNTSAPTHTTFSVCGNAGDIYVLYDLDTDKLSSLGMDGYKFYNIKLKGTNYLNYNSGAISATATSLSTTEKKNADNVWRLEGNNSDPYDVRLYSLRNGDHSVGGSYGGQVTAAGGEAVQTFVLTDYNGANKKFELLATNSGTNDGEPYGYLALNTSDSKVKVMRDAAYQHVAAEASNKVWMLLEPVTMDFKYKLYDLSGNLILQGEAKDVSDLTPSLPEFMRSPLVADDGYYYWQEAALANPLTMLSQVGADNTVYVSYEPLSVEKAGLKLDGSEVYTLFANSDSQKPIAPDNHGGGNLKKHAKIHYRDLFYKWKLLGHVVNGRYDPYSVALYAYEHDKYAGANIISTNTNQTNVVFSKALNKTDYTSPDRFMILQGDNGFVELARVKNRNGSYTDAELDVQQYVYIDDAVWGNLRTGQGSNYKHENANMQLQFQPPYTYHILNLQGKEAVTCIEPRMVTKGVTTPLVPERVQSPLISSTSFSFYTSDQFTVSDAGVYMLKDNATPMTYVSEAEDAQIFAIYTAKDIGDAVDISGQVTYSMHFYRTWDNTPSVAYYTGSSIAGDTSNPDDATIEAEATNKYLWRFSGFDPYNVQINSAALSGSVLSCNDGGGGWGVSLKVNTSPDKMNTLMLLSAQGGIDADHKYNLVFTDHYTGNNVKFLFLSLAKSNRDASAIIGGDQRDPYWGNDFTYTSGKQVAIKIVPHRKGKYTYVVINRSGKEAIRYRVEGTTGVTPEIPAAIKSPYAKNFKYYHDYNAATKEFSNEITADNAATYVVNNAIIYVSYEPDTDALSNASLDLTGQTGGDTYNIWTNGVYLYCNASDNALTADANPSKFDDTVHEWYLEGTASQDPYNVRLRSKQNTSRYIELATYNNARSWTTLSLVEHNAANDVQSFILMDGQAGKMELLAATGAKTNAAESASEIKNRLAYLGFNGAPQLLGVGSDDENPEFQSGMNQLQVVLRPPHTGVTYHIMNLNGLEAVRYTVDAAKGDALEVPEQIRSPFATNWQFWSNEECTSPLTVVPNANTNVYVTYTYDDDTQAQLQLDGTRFYNMQVHGSYLAESDGAIEALTETLEQGDRNATANLWAFDGQTASKGVDPYALHLVNKSNSEVYAGAPLSYANDTETTMQMADGETENFRATFFLVGTSADGPFEMVLAPGANITDNVLAYVNRHEETTVSLNRDDTYTHGNAALQVQMTPPVNQYLYKVYNRDGNLAIQAWGDGVAGEAPIIPDVIRSPLVSQFYYDVEQLPYSNGQDEIHVTYDFDSDKLMSPNLLGTKLYNLKFRNNYFLKTSTGSDIQMEASDATNKKEAATVLSESASDIYIWKPTGKFGTAEDVDPYNITLKHSNGKIISASAADLGENSIALAESNTYDKFIILEGTDGRYEFMAATGDDIGNTYGVTGYDQLAYLAITDANAPTLARGNAYSRGKTAIQVELQPFQFEYTYIVINNSNEESLRYTEKQDAGDPLHVPDVIRSPLIADNEFIYYADGTAGVTATANGNYITAFEISGTPTTASLVPYEDKTFYVRYNYVQRELDLSKKVKYLIRNVNGQTVNCMYANHDNGSGISNDNNAATDHTGKAYQFRLDGDDPYNVKITSERNSRTLMLTQLYYNSGVRTDRGLSVEQDSYAENGTNGEKYSAKRFAILGHDNGDYRLMALTPFYWRSTNEGCEPTIPANHERYYPITYLWGGHAQARVDGQLLGMNAGEGLQIVFIPATTHNYRFHLTTKIDQRKLIVEKPNTMARALFELPEELMRKYCTYTVKYYVDKNDDASNDATRMPVEEGTDGAIEKTLSVTSGTELYPFFEAIDNMPETTDEQKAAKANTWVDIYVDYHAHQKYVTDDDDNYKKNSETGDYELDPEGMPFNVMGWNRETVLMLLNNEAYTDYLFQINNYENLTEPLVGTTFGLQRKDYLYFMVLKTNNDFSNTNGQYFLRREDNGRISYLNNDYTLHKDPTKNYKGWGYSRMAEAYRANDHSVFEEKKWLFCFAGDPYDFYIFNANSTVEEEYNDITEQKEFVKTHRDHLVSYTTLTNKAGTTTEYAVNTPSYSESAPSHYRWGLAYGSGQATESNDIFSLITSEFTATGNTDEYENPSIPAEGEKPLYWRMDQSKVENKTELMLRTRPADNNTLDYNIQVLPYEPTQFQDVRLVYKRNDEVAQYTAAKGSLPPVNVAKAPHMSWIDNNLSSGTVRMYTSIGDRMYVAGDEITADDLPLELKRQFCKYSLYSDIYTTKGSYVVTEGPWRGSVQKDDEGNIIYNEQGKAMYNYYTLDEDGNHVGSPPQTAYVEYAVTTDMFLKQHPTVSEVEEMVANNDHVYFMDFADPTLLKGGKLGYNTGHHAYFEEEETFEPQIRELHEDVLAEKMIWNGSQFVYDTKQKYNYCQYKTTNNRMESVPEHLKWYFVGDPYKLQVYCTEYVLKNKEPQGNLCRFDPTESSFQFVVDCVHFRTPDPSIIDERKTLEYTDDDGNIVEVDNNNYGKPYYSDFYWDVVPTISDEPDAFALRFRADNQLLGYRDVFYYLAHDGITRTYREAQSENKKAYRINLSYDQDNNVFEQGKYVGYHQANSENCVIRLIQPAKVYFTAYKEAYAGEPVVKEELSEYFGVGETITEVPRHLQRKFVKYDNLQYQKNHESTWNDASFGFTLQKSLDVAYNLENCKDVDPVHTIANGWVYQEGTKYDASGNPVLDASDKFVLEDGDYTRCRASYKFRVTYEVDDITKDGIHLFTTLAEFANPNVQPQWLDVNVNGTTWMYYDKTHLDSDKLENDTTHVSKYPVVTNANEVPDGWDIGLKGLHWAFVGDPYKFTMVNRRRWEDTGMSNTAQTDQNFWLGTGYGQNKALEDDGTGTKTNLWYNYTKLGDTNANTEYGRNGTGGNNQNGNTEWSLQMCKTGNAGDYFIRTASPKTSSVSELVGDYANSDSRNMTNDYARIINKGFENLDSSTEPASSSYVLQTFSLETKTKDIQKAEIRTAVAQDEDGADNDCFDAIVRIYNLNGELKATMKHVEVTYGDVVKSLPKTLKRYGCNYIECYQLYYPSYTPAMLESPTSSATTARTEAIATAVASLNNFTGDNKMGSIATFSDATLDKTKFITDIDGRRYLEVAYVYEVEDEVAQYFTTSEDALQDDYTWTNTYFQWDQTYKGTNVRVVTYEDRFDHYEYNADGHIVNEVYTRIEKVEYKSGEEISTPAYGWINSHSNSDQAYADERSQSEEDNQKWSLVGDPYDFEFKNYAQYLNNSHTAMTSDGSDADDLNASNTSASHWAIVQGLQKTQVVNGKTVKVTDSSGNPVYVYYLALIDDETGLATDFVTFERAQENKDLTADKQFLYLKASPLDPDPTGSFYTENTTDVKPFYLSDLMSYANWVVYHLVIAHQHSLDYEDAFVYDINGKTMTATEITASKRAIDQHLVEWLKYNYPVYMVKNTKGRATEVILGENMTSGSDTGVTDDYPMKDLLKDAAKTAIAELLKKASLRDVVNDEIDDYSVNNVGIGNTLTVPWYMKRQFCKYDLYQRDVLRSVTSNRIAYEDDGVTPKTFIDENGVEQIAKEIDWVSVTEQKRDQDGNLIYEEDGVTPAYAEYRDQVLEENGTLITKLNASHKNRMVIVDVVYHVDEDEFRFSDQGRNTTAWYSMLTNNDKDGLMNFSYKDGIGARHGRSVHYTNNYLWAPEGDPYGFVLRNRYATINGTGWDNVAVTTPGLLPTEATTDKTTIGTLADYSVAYDEDEVLTAAATDKAIYTGSVSSTIHFNDRRVTHPGRGFGDRKTWGARNAVYEMFAGNYDKSFLMHPTSAHINIDADVFSSFYMIHNTTTHQAELQYFATAKSIRSDKDANWRMMTTPEQLLPYFERAGYVGGLQPSIANRFDNRSLYTTLQGYKDTYQSNPSVLDFKTIDEARKLVYGGKFYRNDGTTELLSNERRPTAAADLPLKFVSTNLIPLDRGYYRIQAFSRDALDKDGEDLDGTGVTGIQGPRYISGYRFQSEKEFRGYEDHDDNESTPDRLVSGSRWLHFIETDEEHTTVKTFEELNAKIRSLQGTSHYERDIEPHPAMRGNIEILPAEYDPSSIFYFTPTGDKYSRFHMGTQGLEVVGGSNFTRLDDDGTGTDFRLDDIGGTAFTFRTLNGTPSNWDSDATYGVAENIQTNYLCIDPAHRYRITVNADNEMKEIGDSYVEGEDYWNLADLNYGIQDTKWLLQPVGVQTEWPYNQMPLSVRVNKGGQKPDTGTGKGNGTEDNNYYASLYVPFDTRLAKTIDAAFTNTRETPSGKGITLQSVSQLNNMGNPQFIPAGWPVVLRTSQPVTSITKEDGTAMESAPHVDLYLPNTTTTDIPESFAKINLYGEYLEKELTDTDIDAKTNDSNKASAIRRTVDNDKKNIMVVGLPFKQNGSNNVYGDANKSRDYYAYETDDAVGFYTNENWQRGYFPLPAGEANGVATATAFEALSESNQSAEEQSHWATARKATKQQRDNKYVYHNKVYYVHNVRPAGGIAETKGDYYYFLFDDEEYEEQPMEEGVDPEVPNTGVYDLSGRLVKTKEAVMNGTWRRNLKPGVYIVNGRKMTVRKK